MSVRMSRSGAFIACSGEMKSAVPTTAPLSNASVTWSEDSSDRARPMSRIFSVPSLARIRFAGLMSRWMNPFCDACSNPAAACNTYSTARPQLSGPPAATICSRFWPSTYSMTR